jgi:ubiquinol-cytochrome c reductase iron-sulfur subunit
MRARPKDILVSAALLVIGRRRRPRLHRGERERIVPAGATDPGAELVAIALFAAGALCAVAFVAFYALDRLPNKTQLLGGALGLSFCFLAAGLIVTANRLVVSQQVEHDYPLEEHPEDQEAIVQTAEEAGDRLTRRRLFKLALFGTGGALGVALLTPAASLGPILDVDPFYGTPWRRGRRLVDSSGKPYRAADVEEADLYTAFPEGADPEALGSPVVLVRLTKDEFQLPPELARYPAQGIVAFSKICTHAGCAISLYRTPLFPPTSPGPALVCPCHYSTFDPAKGGTVEFGPAGRKLPMLPLAIDGQGFLRAAGNFDGPVGPSWWGVRNRRPTP